MADGLRTCSECGRPFARSNGLCATCDLNVRTANAKEGLALAMLDLEVTHDLTIPSEPPAELSLAAQTIVKLVDLMYSGELERMSPAMAAVDERAPLSVEERMAVIRATREDRATAVAMIVANATGG